MRPAFHARTALAPIALAAALVAGAAPATSAQGPATPSGEYALVLEGNTVMSLRLQEGQDGRLGGSVSVAGKTLAVTGAARGGKLQFVTPSADGSLMHWEAVPQNGGGLAVTLVPPGLDGRPDYGSAQQHVLTWRAQQSGAGSAQGSQWVIRLAAVADSVVRWCAEPWLAESAGCQSAMRVVRKAAPALMVARFASSGKAVALLNTLRGPGGAAAAAPADAPSVLALVEPPAAVAAAADATGEYVGRVGAQPLTIRLEAGAGGALTGALEFAGVTLPLSGSVSGELVEFTTPAPSGAVGRWEGSLRGGRLAVTVTTSQGSERHVLVRRP